MNLIDTHAHIYLPEFAEDRVLMLERAEKEGIKRILMPAIDTGTHAAMLQLEKDNSSLCQAMMGVHPCSVKGDYLVELEAARDYLEKNRFKAVGEIGLDFYWDKSFTKEQYAAFHEQVEWALHFDLPIVIHSRNSIDECIAVVNEHQQGKLKGMFHCFSGNAEQAKKIMAFGFYLGIGGVLTFKNSGLDNVMEEISMEHVLLETDAPYLAPVPFRGKRNEPSYIKYVVDKLAGIKKMDANEIALITTKNAEKLFGV
jgi:TatD DNase family protein